MRFIASLIAACAAAVLAAGAATAAGPRYDMIVVAADDEEDVVQYVRNLDTGAAAAFWSEDGEPVYDAAADSLLEDAVARHGFDEPAERGEDPDRVRIRLFGLEIDVEENGADETAVVSMPLGFGGGKLTVDARDDADGERALVTIADAKAKNAREFVDDIEDATRDQRDAMKAHLGLNR
jgi:hypothetical protein